MTKQICIVLDTTLSMEPSLDVCKKAIEYLSTMLSLIGIQLTIILYGDYNQRLTSPDHDCYPTSKTIELAQLRLEQEGALNSDFILPTGHYITE